MTLLNDLVPPPPHLSRAPAIKALRPPLLAYPLCSPSPGGPRPFSRRRPDRDSADVAAGFLQNRRAKCKEIRRPFDRFRLPSGSGQELEVLANSHKSAATRGGKKVCVEGLNLGRKIVEKRDRMSRRARSVVN